MSTEGVMRDPRHDPQRGDILSKPFEFRRIVIGRSRSRVHFVPHMDARPTNHAIRTWRDWAADAEVVRRAGGPLP